MRWVTQGSGCCLPAPPVLPVQDKAAPRSPVWLRPSCVIPASCDYPGGYSGLLGLVSLGYFSVGNHVLNCEGRLMHLDLLVLRRFGIHRDNSPVTRGRAAVSTQLGEAQVSSNLGCVEFEIKPNILLMAKPRAGQVK